MSTYFSYVQIDIFDISSFAIIEKNTYEPIISLLGKKKLCYSLKKLYKRKSQSIFFQCRKLKLRMKSFDDVTTALFMVFFCMYRVSDSHKQKNIINSAAMTSSKDVHTQQCLQQKRKTFLQIEKVLFSIDITSSGWPSFSFIQKASSYKQY